MLNPRFDLGLLAKAVHEVARRVPADQLFTHIARSLRVPEGWFALAVRRGLDPLLVPPGEECRRDGVEDVLLVRSTSIQCTADQEDLRSADGFVCRGSIEVPVRVLPEPSEVSSFRRTLMGGAESVAVAGVKKYFGWQLKSVLAELASLHAAADLLRGPDAALVARVVQEKLGAACLAAGTCIDGPAVVRFESPAWLGRCREAEEFESRQRRAEVRARIQQALAAAQGEHLDHLVRMLEQMSEATRKNGGAALLDLIRAFPQAERGQMYGALWRLCPSAQRTRSLVVVSGSELLVFEPSSLRRPVERYPLPDTLGALRSVSVDARSLAEGLLMVGASAGVLLVDIQTGRARDALRFPNSAGVQARGGVNRAAMSEDQVFATHSELGLAAWARSGGEGRRIAEELTHDATTVRCVQVVDGRLWWTIDHVLYALDVDRPDAEPVRYEAARATVSAATVHDGSVYVGNVDGQIITWPVGDPDAPRVLRSVTANPVESLDVIDGGGVQRLVVADRSTAVSALVVGDSYVCRYESGARIVRRAAALQDLLVAMDDRRDLLLAWRPDAPERPAEMLIVPHLTGSSIQDLCLVPIATDQPA